MPNTHHAIHSISQDQNSISSNSNTKTSTTLTHNTSEIEIERDALTTANSDYAINSKDAGMAVAEARTEAVTETETKAEAEAESEILRVQNIAFYEGAHAVQPFYKKELESPLSFSEPQSMEVLLQRLKHIMGRSIAELSALAQLQVPLSSSSAKGYVGQLIELFLGSTAHNLPGPDFIKLGVELKTMPVGYDLMPQESTFVCSADISAKSFIPFTQSDLYHKLKHVLFVLIFAPRNSTGSASNSIGQRRVLGYFFFKPNQQQLGQLEADYNEFNEIIFAGRAHEIDASYGNLVQLRPKGMSGKDVVPIYDSEGHLTFTRPRGYYLRTSFTRNLMQTVLQEQGVTPDELRVLTTL